MSSFRRYCKWLFIKKGAWTYGVCFGSLFAVFALTFGYYHYINVGVAVWIMPPLAAIGVIAAICKIEASVEEACVAFTKPKGPLD